MDITSLRFIMDKHKAMQDKHNRGICILSSQGLILLNRSFHITKPDFGQGKGVNINESEV